ncbi:MAG: IS200/IS605 family transposase [Candidatus Komeilibacteria bacterium]|nr:IS200/IS605 family transposase [Candidatus Komeilibacteria bacterium]
MTLKREHHCVHQSHYHIVFPVKYRKALLSQPIVEYIKEIAESISERYELEMEELGCDKDHIHLLCSFHPKYGGGQIVRLFKSIVAQQLFRKFPDLKKELWGGEFWSDGYYLATVGEKGNFKILETYVKNQGLTTEQAQLRLL